MELQDISSLIDLSVDADFTSDDDEEFQTVPQQVSEQVQGTQQTFNPDDFDLEEDDFTQDVDEEELQEVNVTRAFYEESAENLEFPHLLIKGICTEEELKFYRARFVEEQPSIPVYTEVEGIPIKVMNTDLSLQFFLNLRFISDYEVILQRDREDFIYIDLNNPQQLTKFIKL